MEYPVRPLPVGIQYELKNDQDVIRHTIEAVEPGLWIADTATGVQAEIRSVSRDRYSLIVTNGVASEEVHELSWTEAMSKLFPEARPDAIPFPTRDEPSTSYRALSGDTVRLSFVDEGRYEVRLDGQPEYLALILRDGEFFEIIPANGLGALGGTGLEESVFWELY